MVRLTGQRATVGLRVHCDRAAPGRGVHGGDQLEQAVRAGLDRRRGNLKGYGPGP